MADMKRFPLEQYATLELNQVAFPKTGMVVSQVPLGTAFTKDAPCENGMWVVADKAAGAINAPAAATDKPICIVYTAEKEYDSAHYGLKTFGRKIAGDYPRVGILSVGDTITSNCLQFGTGIADAAAIDTALAAKTAIYVVPTANKSVPTLTTTAPAATTTYGKVVKQYTMPNGEKGVQYQIVHVA